MGEIDLRRHERQAFLHDGVLEPADLPLVQQQFLGPQGIGIVTVALFVGGDVHVEDEDLSFHDLRERIAQADAAGPYGFDLGAGEHDAGLVGILKEIVVSGLLVVFDELFHRSVQPSEAGEREQAQDGFTEDLVLVHEADQRIAAVA